MYSYQTMGIGLIFWAVQFLLNRHSLSPTFSVSKLKEMSPIIEKCADRMLDNLRQAVDDNNGRINTKRYIVFFICS